MEILSRLKAAARAEKNRRSLERVWRGDFVRFCALLEIVPRSGVRQPLEPNPIQRAYQETRTARDLVLKPRQVGLTTWELARDIWFFIVRPGARVVVVCQSMSDDAAIRECSEKLRIMFASLAARGLARNVEQRSATEWALPESDATLRIIGAGASEAAAEKKGRSGTIHRLHVTELAFFEYARETMNAILECVPGSEFGTEITIESTANGAAGLFYEMYQAAKEGRSSYRAHFFSWLELPEYRAEFAANDITTPETPREKELVERCRATPEQLKWYRAKVADKGQDLVDQEYPVDEVTCWLVAGRSFFDKAITAALLAKTRAPIAVELGGLLAVWRRPNPGEQFVIAADPAEGVGGDASAAVVLARRTGEHVATLHGQIAPWPFGELLVKTALLFNGALIVVERNNHGHAVLQSVLAGQKYPVDRVCHDRDGRPGWKNDAVSRAAALDALEEAHRCGAWASPDARVVIEQRTFVVNKLGKPEASPGAHDDLILSSAIGWDVLRRPTTRRDLSNLPAA